MKTALISTIAVALALGGVALSKPAQANELALSMCTYVQGDDTMRMRKKLRDSRVRIRDIYTGVQCNGQSLLQFAMSNGSNDVGEFIVRSLAPEDLTASGDFQWAQSNGHAGSPIAAAIKERAGL